MSSAIISSVSKGVLFIGTGDRCREEIRLSVGSIQEVMPDCAIAVFSDVDPGIAGVDFYPVDDAEFGYIDKVRYFSRSPFEKTIFLDSDTYLLKPIDELFTLLDQFDLLAAHEVAREHDVIAPLPAAFPEVNTGVLAYRRRPEVTAFFNDLLETYAPVADKVEGDQTAFRLCLYRSELRLWVLPAEFNCQVRQAGFLGKEVHILHGRNIDLAQAGQKINAYAEKRVFVPAPLKGGMKVVKYSELKLKTWSVIWLVMKKLGLSDSK